MEAETVKPKRKRCSFRYEDGTAAIAPSMRSFKPEGIKKAFPFVEPLEKPTKEKPTFQKPAWVTVPSVSKGDGQGSGRKVLFDVLKERQFIAEMSLEKGDVYKFGKNPKLNDRVLEHPSISGQHAMVLNTEDQTFLVDLGSTHGTKIGKRRIPSRQPIPLYPGTIIRFGASSRMYIYRTFIDEAHLRQSHDMGLLRTSRILREKEEVETEQGKAWAQMLSLLAFNTEFNKRLSYQKKPGEPSARRKGGKRNAEGKALRVTISEEQPFEIPSMYDVGPAPVMPSASANSKGMFADIVTSTVIPKRSGDEPTPEAQPVQKVLKREKIKETQNLGDALGSSVKTTTVVRKKASPAIIAAMKRKAAAEANRKRQGQLLMAKAARSAGSNSNVVLKSKDEEARQEQEDSALEAAEAALNVKVETQAEVVMETASAPGPAPPANDGLDLRKR